MSRRRTNGVPKLNMLANYILSEPWDAGANGAHRHPEAAGESEEQELEGALLRVLAQALTSRLALEFGGEETLAGVVGALPVRAAVLWLPAEEHVLAGASYIAAAAEPDVMPGAFHRQRPRRRVGLTGLAWVRGETCFSFGPAPGGAAAGDPDMLGSLRASVAIPALTDSEVAGVLTLYGAGPEARLQRINCLRETVPIMLGGLLTRWTAPGAPAHLTRRERELLKLASTGRTTREIAGELTLSPWTVKTHFENIRSKLQVSDRTAAVAYALRNGMIG